MRVKTIIEKALRPFPPAFRLGSKVYHLMRPSFRPASPEAPTAIAKALQMARSLSNGAARDYYEFGLFRGYTFLSAYRAAAEAGFDDMRFYGFDSFEGLPEVEGIDRGQGQFFKGQFACSKERVEKNLARHGMDMSRAELIPGYYKDSLTEELKARYPFRQAAVVMLDCDLYSSTAEALSWMATYLADGTVLVFDDWLAYGGDPDLGQPRAFREFMEARPGFTAEALYDYRFHGKAFALHAG